MHCKYYVQFIINFFYYYSPMKIREWPSTAINRATRPNDKIRGGEPPTGSPYPARRQPGTRVYRTSSRTVGGSALTKKRRAVITMSTSN